MFFPDFLELKFCFVCWKQKQFSFSRWARKFSHLQSAIRSVFISREFEAEIEFHLPLLELSLFEFDVRSKSQGWIWHFIQSTGLNLILSSVVFEVTRITSFVSASFCAAMHVLRTSLVSILFMNCWKMRFFIYLIFMFFVWLPRKLRRMKESQLFVVWILKHSKSGYFPTFSQFSAT